MAQRDGPSVDVQPIRIDLELAQAGNRLRGEGLVQLDSPMSSSFRPAIFRTLRIAGTGPIPKRSGSTPAVAKATKRPSGARFNALARAAERSTAAAAPSLVCDELPAVTVPET